MNKFQLKKHYNLYYWLILAVTAGILCVLSVFDRIWADEAYTFALIRHSFPQIWQITAADVHPPLYYFVAKIVAVPFGYSQMPLRILSALCIFAVMAIGGRQLRRLFDERVGLLFMLLVSFFPYGLTYSLEVRMYAMAELAIFLNALFAYRAWKWNRGWDWAGFAAGGIAAAYLHYFALVSAGVIYGLLFLLIVSKRRELLKPWLLVSIVTIAAYLPWLKCFIEQLAFKVNNEYWIEPITRHTILSYYQSFFYAAGIPYYSALFTPVLITALVVSIRRGAWPALLALLVPMLTCVLGVLVSLAVRPIFIVRYLIPCIPLVCFFLAWGLANLRCRPLSLLLALIILAGYASNLVYFTAQSRPHDGTLNRDFIALCKDPDAYLVMNWSSLQDSQVLSYYDPVTPIYVPDALGPDNPYPNKLEISAFSPEAVNRVIVLVNDKKEPDPELFAGFRSERLGIFRTATSKFSAWELTKQ